jgi:hypothetical protein
MENVLTAVLVAAALILVVSWAVVAWLTRKWRKRFRRHPIQTTIALVALLRRFTARPAPRPVVLEGDAMWLACPVSHWQGDPSACRWCNGLLPEDKPRFCGPTCRHTAEANHYFDKATPFVLQRDGFTCQHCGNGEGPGHGLEVNHRTPIRGRHKVPGCHHHTAPSADGRGGLETLGKSCHQVVTNGQRARGWAS